MLVLLLGAALAGMNAASTFSIAWNGAALSTVLFYASPALTAAAAWPLFGERPGPGALVAIAGSVAGEAGGAPQGLDPGRGELAGDLGVDAFAGGEREDASADPDPLRTGGDEPALHGGAARVPGGRVAEGAGIEVGPQVAVGAEEQVPVEVAGDAGRVVVCGSQEREGVVPAGEHRRGSDAGDRPPRPGDCAVEGRRAHVHGGVGHPA